MQLLRTGADMDVVVSSVDAAAVGDDIVMLGDYQ